MKFTCIYSILGYILYLLNNWTDYSTLLYED